MKKVAILALNEESTSILSGASKFLVQLRGLNPKNSAIAVENSQDGPSLKSAQGVKDAMESKMREMCKAIVQVLLLKLGKEAEYESGKVKAIREAIEKARIVIEKKNES